MITTILLYPAFSLLCTLMLWRDYLAVESLRASRAAGRLPKEAQPYGKAILYYGLARDCFYNIFIATIWFLDPPRELLLTSRLERYKFRSSGWRHTEAEYWCRVFLDPYPRDGCHCKE